MVLANNEPRTLELPRCIVHCSEWLVHEGERNPKTLRFPDECFVHTSFRAQMTIARESQQVSATINEAFGLMNKSVEMLFVIEGPPRDQWPLLELLAQPVTPYDTL